jgi:peptidoglycan/xylan/chitin deacetylase (PgdA/CDA1 family)
VSVLCYHTVDPAWRSGLSIDPAAFGEHCRWLARHRRVVDLETAVALMDRRGRLPRGVVTLTFDDGLAGLHEHALPVLRRFGFPAAVFVVSRSLTGDRTVDWIDDPPPHPLETLRFEQLEEMVEGGFTIGSHSQAHRVLPTLDPDACQEDLTSSRTVLEDLFRTPVRHLAYPRGKHDASVRRCAERSGYDHAFALPEGPEVIGAFSLPRVGVYGHNGVNALRVKAVRGYLGLRTVLHPAARTAFRRVLDATPAGRH